MIQPTTSTILPASILALTPPSAGGVPGGGGVMFDASLAPMLSAVCDAAAAVQPIAAAGNPLPTVMIPALPSASAVPPAASPALPPPIVVASEPVAEPVAPLPADARTIAPVTEMLLAGAAAAALATPEPDAPEPGADTPPPLPAVLPQPPASRAFRIGRQDTRGRDEARPAREPSDGADAPTDVSVTVVPDTPSPASAPIAATDAPPPVQAMPPQVRQDSQPPIEHRPSQPATGAAAVEPIADIVTAAPVATQDGAPQVRTADSPVVAPASPDMPRGPTAQADTPRGSTKPPQGVPDNRPRTASAAAPPETRRSAFAPDPAPVDRPAPRAEVAEASARPDRPLTPAGTTTSSPAQPITAPTAIAAAPEVPAPVASAEDAIAAAARPTVTPPSDRGARVVRVSIPETIVPNAEPVTTVRPVDRVAADTRLVATVAPVPVPLPVPAPRQAPVAWGSAAPAHATTPPVVAPGSASPAATPVAIDGPALIVPSHTDPAAVNTAVVNPAVVEVTMSSATPAGAVVELTMRPATPAVIPAGPVAATPPAPATPDAPVAAAGPGRTLAPSAAPVVLPASEAPPLVAGASAPAFRLFAAAMHAARANETDRALPADAAAAPIAPIAPATTPVAVTGVGSAPLDMGDRRWPHAMVDRIEHLREAASAANDAASTSIRLVPDALGTIDVSVRTKGGTVHVHFTAEQAATRTLIAEAQPRLAELAEARGLRLAQADVGGGAQGQGQRPPTPQPSPRRAPASASATRDDQPETTTTRIA